MKEGSYSIEAALIMPGVVLFMITFLMLGFYLRDIVLTEAYSRSLLLDWEKNIDKETEELENSLKECLWYSKIKDFSIYEETDSRGVYYKLVPATDLINMSVENRITIDEEDETSEKIQKWKIWIDEAKKLFLTEE